MVNVNELKSNLCTGCGACANKCVVGAISLEENEEGFFQPRVNSDLCNSCTECVSVCPEINPVQHNKPLAACAALFGEDHGASGFLDGVLMFLAEAVIEKGGTVCGAAYTKDFMGVYQSWARDKAGLSELVKYKDVCSDVGNTYKEAKDMLEDGKTVLYIGTPCVIAGLCSYLGKAYDNLYTVDFVCHGQSSALAHKSFLGELIGKNAKLKGYEAINRRSFGGIFANVAYLKNGEVKKTPAHESLWLDGTRGIINRESCYTCGYARAERVADITLTDGEGAENDFSSSNGAALVLVNTKKGESLFNEVSKKASEIKEISVDEALTLDGQLTAPICKMPTRRFFFTHMDKGYHNAIWYGKNQRFDVGLVGWWFSSNYGSSLTYYALASILKELGKAPIFVQIPKLDNSEWDKDVQQTIDFISKRFKITNKRDMKHLHEVNHFCDSFMVGSDQMWTLHGIKLVGYSFYLDFVDLDKKKIAFSTSFGRDTFDVSEKMRQTVSDYLNRFDAISVREHSGVAICKEKFGIDVEQIIDPVFLCTEEQYDGMIGDVSISLPKKYLLCYILDPSPEKEAAVEAIAKRENLEVLSVLAMRDYEQNCARWHVGTNVPRPTTEEFLYYIKNCSYLVTDSHHGACMGIIYKRPYAAIANRSRGVTRFETVAKALGLEDRILWSTEEAFDNSRIQMPIDYDAVSANIEREKKRALKWLNEAFSKKTKVAVETENTKEARLAVTNNDVYKIREVDARKEISQDMHKTEEVKRLEGSFDFVKIRLLGTVLRDYGIKHIVLSPGGRDVPIIRMFENNSDSFTLHRVTDERSAAYFGLGLASSLNEPVACVCTSGTAASNYLPAVTEAYFTGVPLIVITADRLRVYHGQSEDQTIPQRHIYDGVIKKEITLPDSFGAFAEHMMKRDISDCILESTHNGNGPVHINVPVQDVGIGADATTAWKILPPLSTKILRVGFNDGDSEMYKWLSELKKSTRVLVVYGQSKPLSPEEKNAVDLFASKFNCAILTDSISNYSGKYSLGTYNALTQINQADFDRALAPDILISVGGKRLMNDPLTFKVRASSKRIRHWSVTPDGKIRDFYFKLTSVIESTQGQFFRWFAERAGDIKNNENYFKVWEKTVNSLPAKDVEGFNTFHIQDKFFPNLPKNSFLHLGVGQNFFFVRRHEIDPSVEVYCNMGTNGIDGCTSTFMGQCAVEKEKLCFLIVGDLSFFYDMNGIWNKELGKNVRILMVNNNGSGLLKNHNLKAVTSVHNTVAEGWVKSTGFEYISANNKEDFAKKLELFMSDKSDKPLFFEVFCD